MIRKVWVVMHREEDYNFGVILVAKGSYSKKKVLGMISDYNKTHGELRFRHLEVQ